MSDSQDSTRPTGHPLSRRELLAVTAAALPFVLGARATAPPPEAGGDIGPLGSATLPKGVRARFVENVFAGRTIDVPSTFMGGRSDWGVYQSPGSLERLEKNLTTKYLGTTLVDNSGHWLQQEQPAVLSRLLVEFLNAASKG